MVRCEVGKKRNIYFVSSVIKQLVQTNAEKFKVCCFRPLSVFHCFEAVIWVAQMFERIAPLYVTDFLQYSNLKLGHLHAMSIIITDRLSYVVVIELFWSLLQVSVMNYHSMSRLHRNYECSAVIWRLVFSAISFLTFCNACEVFILCYYRHCNYFYYLLQKASSKWAVSASIPHIARTSGGTTA